MSVGVVEELKESLGKIHQNAKTSKEIAVYLHDALGFALPPFTKKKDVPKRIAELENQRWIPEKFVVGLVGGLQKQLEKTRFNLDVEKGSVLALKKEKRELEELLEKTRKLVKKARISVETGHTLLEEVNPSHSVLGYEDVMNCIAGKLRKTRKGNFVIPLIDITNREYGKLILIDDFDLDLSFIENVSLQKKRGGERK